MSHVDTSNPADDRGQPINRVVWVDVNLLQANDYNPNNVDKPEMDLLALSIREQGWVQPILVWPVPGEVNEQGDLQPLQRYVIIDGFHRHKVCKTYKDVWAMTGGRVPVVVMEMSVAERMLLTIRINRAKGTHAALKMHEIVAALVTEHQMHPQEVARKIGADRAEIELLMTENVFQQKDVDGVDFSAAWCPKGIVEHGLADV